ncbi:MAG: hypothetical protein NT167_01620 [Verrucomicrobia bacterium]|nr:hypothetical protein [Verrucomicrobiota bacterium]
MKIGDLTVLQRLRPGGVAAGRWRDAVELGAQREAARLGVRVIEAVAAFTTSQSPFMRASMSAKPGSPLVPPTIGVPSQT